MTLSKILKNSALGLAAFGFLAAASASYPADLVMWERSGGNKDMVDKLVEMWNVKYPDRHINLTYIPHAEMVAKLAQAIASGEVPDLMGMDLIYAPQFEKAGQLVDLTDLIGNLPELKTASPGHMMVATYDNRLYGVPLYADVSALFYNKDLFEKRASTPTSRRGVCRNSARTPTRSPLSAATSRVTIFRAHAPGATSSPLVPSCGRQGLRSKRRTLMTNRSSATASPRCFNSNATWSSRATCTQATGRKTARLSIFNSDRAKSE